MTECTILYDGPIIKRSEAKVKGLTQYFTGKPCVNNHIDLRWTCSARCKACQRKSSDEHYLSNIERYKENGREYSKKRWSESKEELSEINKIWRENNKDYNRERMKKFRNDNPDYFKKYSKEYMTRPIWKMINHMKGSMRRVLKGASDGYSTKKLGYTSSQLKSHIESQFKDGMSWENYGEWEIDHKIPMKWYFDNGIDDPKVVNAMVNLQPLWMVENRIKGARYEP